MVVVFLIGGFIFFTIVVYFIVLIIWPEWVGVSGRDHQKSLDEQKEREVASASNSDEKR